MLISNIVKLSELKGAKRIDAERYSEKNLKFESDLKKLPTTKMLKSLIIKPVRTGHTPGDRDIYERDNKIFFIKTDTLREGLIDFDNCDFLPERSVSKKNYLEPNDVIVTIIGAHFDIVGRATIFQNHYASSAVNQNIAVISPDETVLNPNYLMAFINSKYGREQLWMLSRQTEQVNLNCREVEELLVPLFDNKFQSSIEEIVRSSCGLVDESKVVYSSAEDLISQYLKLDSFTPEVQISYSDRLREAFKFHRVDAEYFQPIYQEVKNYLKANFDIEKLINFADRFKVKIKPTSEQIYKYIEISDIKTDIGEITYTERLGQELPPNARIPINGGELIVSKVRPTRRAIGIIPEDLKDNSICSSAFSIFCVPSPLREYIFMFLRTTLGIFQLEQPTTGSEYPVLKDKDVENIYIPVPSEEIQQKIALLVQKAYQVREKAKLLLRDAIRKIEDKIAEVKIEASGSQKP